ncbi:sperm motility kinase 3A-like [Penaeus japonicus]|uniref:sperm motility kinase 3A-like n=1 Tax=Penaeus japonicus TaxID=27405 RepID=UPI001C711EDC|nr:sperm motility kinase 3A-like [Penaeus japonicus]
MLEKERKNMEKLAGAGGAPLALAYCPQTPALVMSYCGKRDLFDLLTRDSSLEDRDYLGVALKVTKAIQEIHEAGMVHSDLKLDNVVVETSKKGEVQSVHIIDFGLSVPVGGRQGPKKSADRKEWYCGCYYSGDKMKPKCDVVGLGVILTEVLDHLEEVPEELDDMVERTQEFEHELRPEVEEVRELLERLLR